MADETPKPPDRKLTLIGPLSIVAVVAVILLGVWLMRPKEPPEQVSDQPLANVAAPPKLPIAPPTPPPPLSRGDLIARATTEAGAFAEGTAAPAGGRDPMVGRPFSLRIAFACDGPQVGAGGGQAFAEYDATKRTIRLVARPADWTQLPLIQELPSAADVERVEGFWLPRPWTSVQTCPPKRDDPAPLTPTPPAAQTLGLARLFEANGSRVLRRGDRPYEFVRKLPEGDSTLLTHTYSLVLEGRVVGFANGRAARCWGESADHRPVCLYAVVFDRVAFEDAAGGELLAEWRE